jgi:ParB family chromosome partitioning protein
MEHRVLGKGLEALIPKKAVSQTQGTPSGEFSYLPLTSLVPGKYQPRQELAGQELEELCNSIRQEGIIQPIIVRRLSETTYEIVAGGRRFEAARSLGLTQIPAIIKTLDDKNALVFAIVENLQRKDLNPIEEALAFSRLMDEFEFKLDDVSKFIGKDKTTVSNTLRLLRLPLKIQDALKQGLLSRSQARTILAAPESEQEKLFYRILEGGLTVRAIEEDVKRISPRKPKKASSDPFAKEVEDELQKLLGTKVAIQNNRKNRGKIVIEYYSLNDLERILDRLKR